ncbi:SLBB domain-containing protein, partial [Bacteroides fragilis]
DSVTGTIKRLIQQAEGLRGDAFLNRALLRREREDLSHEMIPVDLKKLMEGTAPDLPLQKNDVLYISSIKELEEEGVLFIYGDVAKPGYFPFARNMSVQDLILKAGG